MSENIFWDCYPLLKALYYYPFYEFDSEERETEITVITNEEYNTQTEHFIGYVLQLGQSNKRKLKVNVFSPDPKEFERKYLENKPALENFIQINERTLEDNYGEIHFYKLPEKDFFDDETFLEKIEYTNYFYLDLEGNLAQEIVDFIEENDYFKTLIITRKPNVEASSKDIILVNLDNDTDYDEALEDMGLNVHLSWSNANSSNLYPDLESFLDEYNHLSSLLSAISIIYKLNDIQFNPDDLGTHFKTDILENKAVYEELADLEHRRWLLEKVTEGYNILPKERYKEIKKLRKNYTQEPKLHACLVKSTPGFKLDEYSIEDWNTPSKKDELLDPLDQVSLNIHRMYKNSVIFQKQKIIDNIMKMIDKIKNLSINQTSDFLHSVDELGYDVKKTLDSDEKDDNLLNTDIKFLKSALIEDENAEAIQDLLDKIVLEIYPLQQYNKFVDYKRKDGDIISNIPMILTYKNRPVLTQAFNISTRANSLIDNVAGASILSPKKINYLVYLSSNKDVDHFIENIKSTLNFIRHRLVECDVNFTIAIKASIENRKRNLEKKLTRIIFKNEPLSYEIDIVKNEKKAFNYFLDFIEDSDTTLFNGTTRFFEDIDFDYEFKDKLKSSDFSYFTFSTRNQEFRYFENCPYLINLNAKEKFLQLSDAFLINNTYIDDYNIPDFEKEYADIWKIATGFKPQEDIKDRDSFIKNLTHWNSLSSNLSDYHEKADIIGELVFKNTDKNSKRSIQKITVEARLGFVFKEILEYLAQKNFIDSQYKFEEKDNNIVAEYKTAYKKLDYALEDIAYNLSKLLDRNKLSKDDLDDIIIRSNYQNQGSYDTVVIEFNFQTVDIDRLEFYGGSKEGILIQLRNKGIIKNLKYTPNWVDSFKVLDDLHFEYVLPKYKDLLTKAGEILEIYSYYELKNSGYFDEVATGITVTKEDTNETNEFDIIAIKGYQIYLMECKQKKTLEQKDVNKLLGLNMHYGINTNPFLILSLTGTNKQEKNRNRTNIARAQGHDFNVIYEPRKLSKIAESISEIIEND